MILTRIRAVGFRNIISVSQRFTEGVNILYGENAQGKTNLMEAIQLCGCGKSFRGAKDAEMVGFGEESFAISLNFTEKKQRKRLIVLQFFSDARKKRQIYYCSQPYESMVPLVGKFRTVLFTPDHLQIIKEGPALRRQFMDLALCSLYPRYLGAMQRYNRILKERNALIKSMAEKEATGKREEMLCLLEAWSVQLAKEAGTVAVYRIRFVENLNRYVGECFAEMTGGREVPQIRYAGFSEGEGEQEISAAYLKKLTATPEREIGAGATLWGPHRDDLEIELNGKPARVFASQGQQRSLALAMKLAEGQIYADDLGEHPVYLFDDVMSELDTERREYLLRRIVGKQVIITCCDPSVVNEETRKNANIIQVRDGEFL